MKSTKTKLDIALFHVVWDMVVTGLVNPNKGRTQKSAEAKEEEKEVIMEKPRLDFGDYAMIEQKRHGADNEHYLHKVIGVGKSNVWVDVPVQSPAKETFHDHMEYVVRCVCCGIDERDILKYKASDVKPRK